MINHILHKKVADAITNIIKNKYNIYLDPACEGNQHLPFFISVNAGLESAVSKVDLILTDDKFVKLVCEIEESGFNPTKIYGKVFSTASAIMAKLNKCKKYDLDKEGVFIQVISSKKIEDNLLEPSHTKKYIQGILIEKTIRLLLKQTNTWITNYYIIFGTESDFDVNGKAYQKLEEILKLNKFIT